MDRGSVVTSKTLLSPIEMTALSQPCPGPTTTSLLCAPRFLKTTSSRKSLETLPSLLELRKRLGLEADADAKECPEGEPGFFYKHCPWEYSAPVEDSVSVHSQPDP